MDFSITLNVDTNAATEKYGDKQSAPEQYTVTNYRMRAKRQDDGTHPTSTAKVEVLELTLLCDKIPSSMYDWLQCDLGRNGNLTFLVDYGNDVTTSTRVFKFENAQCFYLQEDYNRYENQREMTIKLTVEKMSFDNYVTLKRPK